MDFLPNETKRDASMRRDVLVTQIAVLMMVNDAQKMLTATETRLIVTLSTDDHLLRYETWTRTD